MLNGQVVAISGGCGRIGSAIATAVVANNGIVVMGDVSRQKGVSLSETLEENKRIFVDADLTVPHEIDRFIEEGVSSFGRIDAAIHCAYPVSEGWGRRFEDISPEHLAQDLYRQLGGAIVFSQRLIRHFRHQGYGNLIHVSSIQGVAAPKFEHYEGTDMTSPIEYSAIKAGVIAVTRYLAKYCKGQSIRVNCVSPGGILDAQPGSFLQQYRQSCTNKGMLDAGDITGTLLFLLSQHSAFINGQNIIVDDGWVL